MRPTPGQMIQRILTDLHMSQSELAKDLGVSTTFTHCLIHDTKRIPAAIAVRLEYLFGVDALEFMYADAAFQLDRYRAEAASYDQRVIR